MPLFKRKELLLEPDERHDQLVRDDAKGWRRMVIEDLHGLMQPLELGTSVPEGIRREFDIARNTFIYSWFCYELVTLAEHAYGVLEVALRDRIAKAGGDSSKANGIKQLYEMAFRLKCARREDFEMPSPFQPGQTILQFEIIRMLRNNLAHGQMHLLPDGSLTMMQLCAEIIGKLYADGSTTVDKDAA
jgi:hypothetical protein